MDREGLKARISENGMTIASVCKVSGLNPRTLYYKLSTDSSEFTTSEVVSLAKALHLTKSERDHIFLDD